MAKIAEKCPDIQVVVVDINEQRNADWNTEYLPGFEPGLLEVVKTARGRNLHFSTDVEANVSDADIVFICVNTPTKTYGEGAGKALCEHPLIKAIGFVGESRTGSMIMAQGAPTLKRVHFELGGKNPVIVFADADLDRAAEAAVFMIYSLNGERCTSSSRLLVEDEIYDEFTAKIAGKRTHPKIEKERKHKSRQAENG